MACGGCAAKKASTKWLHVAKDGKVTEKATEVEARAAAARLGGTYRPK